MKSLRELGLALSFVFAAFLLALIAELCYIFYWKNRSQRATSLPPSSTTIIDDIKQLNMNVMSKLPGVTAPLSYFMPKQAPAAHDQQQQQQQLQVAPPNFMGGYNNYTAAAYKCLISSFNINIDPNMGYDHAAYATAAGFLFPIKEETKEDMEQLDSCSVCSYGSSCKRNSQIRNRTPSDVLTIPFTTSSSTSSSGSSSPTHAEASEDSSINVIDHDHKIFITGTDAADADKDMLISTTHHTEKSASHGSFMVFGTASSTPVVPEPAGVVTNSAHAVQHPWPVHRSSTTLRLLFENSPVLAPGYESSYSSYVRQKQHQQQKQIMDGLPPSNCAGNVSEQQHLSLAALFQMPQPTPPTSTCCPPPALPPTS